MLGVGGCVAVNGGAVELSWIIRESDGSQADCSDDTVNVATVALCVRSCDAIGPGGECTSSSGTDDVVCPTAAFECQDHRGNTPFEIPPGRKELWIRVSCAGTGGATPNVTLPGSLIRDVVEGEVTELDALLITVPSGGAKACPAP
jgi:hypothetical protein